MRYLKLEDYISTLSERERELYKRLIQESRERDSYLKKNYEESRKSLEELSGDLAACGEAVNSLKKALRDLNATIIEVHSKIYFYAKTVSRYANHNGHMFQEYPNSLN